MTSKVIAYVVMAYVVPATETGDLKKACQVVKMQKRRLLMVCQIYELVCYHSQYATQANIQAPHRVPAMINWLYVQYPRPQLYIGHNYMGHSYIGITM